jgi:hypothetical protein
VAKSLWNVRMNNFYFLNSKILILCPSKAVLIILSNTGRISIVLASCGVSTL